MPDSGAPDHDPQGGEGAPPPWQQGAPPPWQQGAPPPPPSAPRPSPPPAATGWDEWDDERRPATEQPDVTGVLPAAPPAGGERGPGARTEMAGAPELGSDAPPSGAPGGPPAGYPGGPPPGGAPLYRSPGPGPSPYDPGSGPGGEGPGGPSPWSGTDRPGGPPSGPPPGYPPSGAAGASGGTAPPRPQGPPSGPPQGQPLAPPPGGPPPGYGGGPPPGYGGGPPPGYGGGYPSPGTGQVPPYGGPGQGPPGYPQGGPGGATGRSGPSALEGLLRAPWLLGALGILAGYLIAQLSDIIFAFQHFPGLPGRARLLRFFGNATLGWAVALVVAAVLLSLAGRYYPVGEESTRSRLHLARLGVAGVAAFTVVSAMVDLVASLVGIGTDTGGGFGRAVYSYIGLPAGIDGAFTAALTYLSVAVISAAVALWAFGLARVRDQ